MKKSPRECLPLAPLLHAYTRAGTPSVAELHHLPALGPRFAAVLSASVKFLYADFLDNAPAADLTDALVRFYESCVSPPLHVETLRRRAGIVRHGLAYLLRGRDALPIKMAACLDAKGIYHVAGLGPAFWSAVLQALCPERHPSWIPAVLAGVERLGLMSWPRDADAATVYAGLLSAYARIQAVAPALSALHVDHFLARVAALRGRDLPGNDEIAEVVGGPSIADAARRERARQSLRERLKERGQGLAHGQERMESALANCDGKGIGDALAAADLESCLRSPLDWGEHADMLTLWVGRLWETDEPYRTLAAFWNADPFPGAGLWLPAAVLHLRDPQQFVPWSEDIRAAHAALDDSAAVEPPAERYRLLNESIAWLRRQHQLHPLEIPAVLAALSNREPDDPRSTIHEPRFDGFCADTFAFLTELVHDNKREWMERQRDRYRFAVRAPLVELCRVLAERYVAPVLRGVHGWHLDTEARGGHALTSICKNAYGRSQPYNTALWIVFCRRLERGREDVQFFVRLDGEGLRFGLRLGRKARAAVPRFRQHIRQNAELLFHLLRERGALNDCRFGHGEASGPDGEITNADDLCSWAEGRAFEVSRHLSTDAALLPGDELAGEIVLTFDRLLPLYACAIEEDAASFLLRCRGGARPGEPYREADFHRATLLGSDWLQRVRGLLELKRQLILQGVPGTGKTHVARHLARLLTGGRDECVRLVQFHPAYSYEEFVEGVKVRSVTVDGRSDVAYPIEEGLLCAFAAEASRRPSEPFVLLIDEINRGNLPRIFGELLYLLEYREQSVCLPCSRRSFRLPANLYLLATMNAADRSVSLIDQALRRRFSFVDMPPDTAVLVRWLQAHAPPAFAERVRLLFEHLNARLRADLGPQGQVGHSYFMVPDLDEAKLRIIWQHHVRPLLEEHFTGHPARLTTYELDKLLEGHSSRPERRSRVGTV